jgi:MFS family permease
MEQRGALASASALVYGLCAPVAGHIVDRVRRKTAILGGLQVWSVICMATALSRNFTQLRFFRAAEGLGESFYYPASTSLISDYHGKATRSRALGLHQTSVYVGTIGGGFFAGLIGQYYGWKVSFIVFGGAGVLLGLFLQRFLFEPVRGSADVAERITGESVPVQHLALRSFFRLLRRTPTVLTLMLAFLCANFVAMVLLTWMPEFLYEKFQLSLAMAGLTATLYVQLASMAGAALGGWLADALWKRTAGGRILVQALGVFAGAPFVYVCGQTRSVPWLIVALTAWGLFKGLYDANIFAAVFDVVPPRARGTTAGFMNLVGWLGGGATAPLVIAWLAERYDLSSAISSAALVYVAAGILLLLAALVFVKRDLERVQAPD